MGIIDFQTLILYILDFIKSHRDGILITRLIKLAYLIEVFYYRKFRQRLTNAEWVYYKYGPYLMNIGDYLKDKRISAEEFGDDEKTKFVLNEYVKLEDIPVEIKTTISSTVKQFLDVKLDDLLDYVYYETEPMMNAERRGDKLDFSSVLPSDYYKIKEIKCSDKVIKDIQEKYKLKIKNAKTI